ncbi:MAG: hypothetical protein N4A40_12270, partial [Tissierellales bacterium]|nr:hypothetical protein [Tissierellales bacterium]
MKSTKRLVSFLICFFMMFQLCAGVLAEGVTTNVVNNKDEVETEDYKEIDASLNEVSQKIEAKIKPTSIRIPEEEETLPFYIDSEVNGDEIDTYFVLQGEFDGDETLSLSVYDGDNELLAEEIDCDSERIELSGIETGKEYYVEFVSSKEIDVDVLLGIADHFVDTADYEKKYICRYKVNVELENEQIEYVENEFFDVNYMSYYKTATVAENIEKIRKEKGLEIGQKLDVLGDFMICPEGEAKSRRGGRQRVENESNDSFSSADRIEDDDNMIGWIGERGDEDFYEIEFSRDGLVNFWIGNIPDGEDYNIYVYDDDDEDDLVYRGDEEGNGGDELISYVPIRGDRTYYIKVEGDRSSDYDSQHNYTLRAKWKEEVEEDEYEDNDDIDEAEKILTLGSNDYSESETINATLHDSDDDDYYRIQLKKDASIRITLEDIPEYCDYELKLYDEDGDKIAQSKNDDNEDEEIEENLKRGDYYIKVYGGFSDEEYELTVEANAENNEYEDEFEPNNDADEAENILVFSKNDSNKEKTIKATLHNDDDVDYYLIELDKEADIEINLEDIPRFSDYNLKLYDHNEDEVARSTNDNDEDEKIEERLEKGDYYIKVYKDYSNKEYKLTVKATSIIPGNDIIQADGKWFKIKNPENVQEMMSDSPRMDLKDKDIFVKVVESKYNEKQVIVCDDGELQGQLYAGTGSNWSQSGNQVVAIPTNSIAVASNIRTRGFF